VVETDLDDVVAAVHDLEQALAPRVDEVTQKVSQKLTQARHGKPFCS
jgi:hypothetical protein